MNRLYGLRRTDTNQFLSHKAMVDGSPIFRSIFCEFGVFLGVNVFTRHDVAVAEAAWVETHSRCKMEVVEFELIEVKRV